MPLQPAPFLQLTRPPSPRRSHALRHPFSTHPVPRSAASVTETPASSGESPGSWRGFASSGFALVLPRGGGGGSPPRGPGRLQPLAKMALGASSQMLPLVFLVPPQCQAPLTPGRPASKEPGFRPWDGGGRAPWPPALHPQLPRCTRVPEEPGAEEPTSPEESSGLSLLHQESKRRAMLAAVLEQELPSLAESLDLKQEQVGVRGPTTTTNRRTATHHHPPPPVGGEAGTASLRTAFPTPAPPPAALLTRGNPPTDNLSSSPGAPAGQESCGTATALPRGAHPHSQPPAAGPGAAGAARAAAGPRPPAGASARTALRLPGRGEGAFSRLGLLSKM